MNRVSEILIIAIVFFALFGYKKLPDATRAIGRSLRIFKSEMHGLQDDDYAAPAPPADVPVASAQAAAAGPAPAQPSVSSLPLGSAPDGQAQPPTPAAVSEQPPTPPVTAPSLQTPPRG